ncbi:helix-turn-helix domain-containing protein [Mucilaginibacter kameinonensis]|uniref:helix-turn-helix domain-containing protein n=1 Tax=Mucilaginibacter kameinonensis TaxID=452286 RepID=UPI000EF84C1D|nr:AraC family transcriptional regulator [Mucilaginibacter kameinonensis]
MKATTVPQELIGAPFYRKHLSIDSMDVVESCAHNEADQRGGMFLRDHMLLFVLEGVNRITHGKRIYTVFKNEMVLLKKNTSITYDKTGSADTGDMYDSVMFFLKDEFLSDFMKTSGIKTIKTEELASVNVMPVTEPLLSFITSIKAYFNGTAKIDKGLVRIKITELLYDLAQTDHNLLLQLIQLKKQIVGDIAHVIEENYMNPLKLVDLAYLSGRSLASFKRDFNTIYKTSPAQFLKEKRLNKAKELLTTTDWPVTEIGLSVGFENVSHFVRVYKEFSGTTPTEFRKTLAYKD